MLDIRHLQTMTALRRHGSLAGAAEETHVTASAISHQLKELEHYYGLSFVDRRSRPIGFTPAGMVLLDLADATLPKWTQTKKTLHRMADGQTGQLRLASECHSCFDWLMPILNQFRRDWPDVELDFATGFEPHPHDNLLQADNDLLITTSRLPLSGLAYHPLFTYESRLVMAPTHELAEKPFVQPEDLTKQTLIAYPVETERLDVMVAFMQPAGQSFANIRHTELTAMLVQLVASERGIAALPDWVAVEYEKKGWVVSKSLGKAGVRCQLYAAVRKDSENTAYVRGFLELLKRLKNQAIKNKT